jgi:NAD:arginine ADP-ribosyltransferase
LRNGPPRLVDIGFQSNKLGLSINPTHAVSSALGGAKLQTISSLSDAEIERAFMRLVRNHNLYGYYCDRAKLDRPGSPLTRWEHLAIFLYSKTFATFFEAINARLRTGEEPSEEVGIVSRILADGLQKLSKHDGMVARGIRVRDLEATVVRYRLGQVIEWRAFSSCSTDEAQAIVGNVLFIIQSKNGRVLGEFAEDPREGEVLFPPGSTFVSMAWNYAMTGPLYR